MSVRTFEYTKIIGIENIEFGHNIIIDDFVLIYAKAKAKIGNFVHIGAFTSIAAGEYFEMADYSTLSHGVRICTRSDDFTSWGFGNSAVVPEEHRNIKSGPIILEKFSIIGANVVVLPGVRIGEGVSVGACSVVTRDLEPWGVYIGNKRVAERDRGGVMKNYSRFCANNDL